MKPIGTIRIIKNGRITIPKGFREKYNWEEKDLLMLYDKDGELRIDKLEK